MTQSVSPPDSGTTPDTRSLTDLWRDVGTTIREHAQVEHPQVAWDDQAAVFTTGRFAEGRAR